MTSNDDFALEVIEGKRLVTPEQVASALGWKAEKGGSVLDALVEQEFVSRAAVLKALAEQFDMELVSLVGQKIPPDAVAAVSSEIARRYKVMPVARSESGLTVAIGDPFDMETLDTLRHVLKCEIHGVIAPPDEIRGALEHYYALE
ncbi:MAG: hypothetical protein WCP86_11520, partial [bacterium]